MEGDLKKIESRFDEVANTVVQNAETQAYRIVGNTIKTLSDIADKNANDMRTILNTEALVEFNSKLNQESINIIANGFTGKGASDKLRDFASKLHPEIESKYGTLDASMQGRLLISTADHVNNMLTSIPKQQKKVNFEAGKKSLNLMAMNSHTMSQGELMANAESIANIVSEDYGTESAELIHENFVQSVRMNENNNPDINEHSPIIRQYSEKTVMTSKLSTNQLENYDNNPMLARAFLRIYNLSDNDALNFASQIKEKFPDSPEAGAIQTAVSLRADALQKNPLEYGSNQNYFKVWSNPVDAFLGEGNARLLAVQSSQKLFGTTNMFTNIEREQLKLSHPDVRAKAFFVNIKAVNTFNLNQPERNHINIKFIEDEMKSIDKDAFSYVQVADSMPSAGGVKYSEVLALKENLKANKQLPTSFVVPDQLLGVGDIGSFIETASIANFAVSGDEPKEGDSKKFFSTNRTYAYLKKFEYGDRFHDVITQMIHKNVELKNIGVNLYRVYDNSGVPALDRNGKTIDYTGDFLNEKAKKLFEK